VIKSFTIKLSGKNKILFKDNLISCQKGLNLCQYFENSACEISEENSKTKE